MEAASNPRDTLIRLLRQEITSATSLLQFLQEERGQLAGSEAFVDPRSDDKLALINALQQASGSRMEFAGEHGLPQSPAESPAAGHPGDAVQSLYGELSQLARDCFEENRRIGLLINRRTQFVTRVLDSLSPVSRNAQSEVYEANGSTSSAPRTGVLGRTRT